MSEQLVIASNNKGKINEFTHLLAPLGFLPVPQGELGVGEAEEPAITFVENAILKARNACAHTGLPALADDSGIEVDYLDGAPGIYSSRYSESTPDAGDATDATNIDKLLHALTDAPANARHAYFICVLVFMRHADDPTPIICQGRWHGQIATQRAGEQGFGYDPVFYCPTLKKHAAQCDKSEKSTVSHRAKALALLVAEMESLLG